ncbi:MAG: dienelactone hydrolase family protein [Chloroflexaceae bacterium]|nr:dienelactone hydrolase family protein [Chloroflexaceae bacterium]
MDRVYVMQLIRALQCNEISRREFITRAGAVLGSLASATLLASACSSGAGSPPPVVSEAETAVPTVDPSSAEGLMTDMVTYPDAEGQELSGYLAHPGEGGPTWPAILVIQEWWGLNDHIKSVANRFAREGFVALCPDLYHGQVVTEPDEARKLFMELDMSKDGTAVNEVRQAADFLLNRDDVAGDKVAMIGFCMGGRMVLQTARGSETIAPGVVFYGSPLTAAEANEVTIPILGLFGDEDQSIQVADVRTMEEAFNRAGIQNEIHIYEGAGHAFFNDTRESYNEAAATDAWQRTLNWLQTHGTGDNNAT